MDDIQGSPIDHRPLLARLAPFIIIVVFVTASRALYFGDPVVGIDEQFYLVVADKWLNSGLIPYVDIWDRKPIGIFLIYAPAVLLFKNPIIGYQVLGLFSVLATCAVVYRMGSWFGGRFISLAAALFYAAILMLWSGAGGQTPVFYNLPIALGAYLILRLIHKSDIRGTAVAGSLLGASLLFGLALQIKYVCVVEICFLCVLGLVALIKDQRLSLTKATSLAVAMIFCGLLPTLIAGGAYAMIGHWPEFWFANFESIFAKKTWRFTPAMYVLSLLSTLVYCIVFWIFTGYALARGLKDRPTTNGYPLLITGLVGWLAAAVAGALILGNPILHYFLPAAAPLAVLSAIGLARIAEREATTSTSAVMRARQLLAVVMAASVIATTIIYLQTTARRGADQVYPIAGYMNEHLNGGCPYVFDDFPILYFLTHCNAPSIYAFPNHLIETAERHALTIDSLTELKRVLDQQPPMIFVRRPFAEEFSAEAIATLEAALSDNYELGKRFPAFRQEFDIYLRKSR